MLPALSINEFAASGPTRRAFWRATALVAALLVAQLGALLHGLEHAVEAGEAPHVVCELCVAYAHLGDAVAAPKVPPSAVLPPATPLVLKDVQAAPLGWALPYNVRAPPVFS